jgi:hypothetical protein
LNENIALIKGDSIGESGTDEIILLFEYSILFDHFPTELFLFNLATNRSDRDVSKNSFLRINILILHKKN